VGLGGVIGRRFNVSRMPVFFTISASKACSRASIAEVCAAVVRRTASSAAATAFEGCAIVVPRLERPAPDSKR
jgi:hypothetical protein